MKGFVLAIAALALSAQAPPPVASCEPLGRQVFLPAVPEASGIASADGALWTHNDSDPPALFRLDASGRPASVAVPGAVMTDWEDLAAAACGNGTCLYIADIGDNRASRERITIYEVPVPPAGSVSTGSARAVHVRYPDRPHDAEAFAVTRKMGTFIITKEVPPRVYTFAASQKPGETGTLKLFRTLKETVRITGAAVSPDERWIALRSNTMLLIYTLDDFAKGGNPIRIDLSRFKEPQGEGVAFGRAGEMYLISEGRGSNASGILTRVRCAFIR